MRTGDTRERAASARGAQAALAAALAVAGGTSAYGAVVRFDNPQGPGHFDWAVPGPGSLTFLDITSDASSQGGSAGLTSLYQAPYYNGAVGNYGLSSPEIQRDGIIIVPFVQGQLIDSAGPGMWAPYAFTSYEPNYSALLPEGVPTYLGVRFDPGDGSRYGWIGVVRTGLELDAFAWGYETEPGVPIAAGAVPAPGSLALLAFGAVAGASRPRRKGC